MFYDTTNTVHDKYFNYALTLHCPRHLQFRAKSTPGATILFHRKVLIMIQISQKKSHYHVIMTVRKRCSPLTYLHLEGVGHATQVAARFAVQTAGESVVVYTVPLVNDQDPVRCKRLMYQALGALRVDGVM